VFSPLDKPAILYAAINKVNKKVYIGVTGKTLEFRKKQHISCALRGIGDGAFARAIRKYGADGFDWKVVEEFKTGADAIAAEYKFIREMKPDYNSTFGGQGFHLRKPMSAEGRARIAAAHKGIQRRLGSTHTQEVKDRLRELGLAQKEAWLKRSHLGPKALARRVVCLNDGSTYGSAAAAARAHGLCQSIVIEVCNRNPRRHTAGGLVFRYEGDHCGGKREAEAAARLAADRLQKGRGKTQRRPVKCLDDGIVYEGAREAAAAYGIQRFSINAVCRGVRNHVGGRKFTYDIGG
jgi:predicted GIY-YIG superfamily endonuclease